MEDIQSWWEIPSIAYFCSLFRTAFNLLDFDIEELEEALLTDGTEESTSYLLTELIVRLLNGCLGNSDISAINYQMYLRRLFRRKCQETGRYNPFDSDIDFQFLPLRTKVEILYELCDFRLDAEDVCDLFKNLEAESLRVEPLGWDDNNSAYWYFYGTRLYREDNIKKSKTKSKKKKGKESKKRGWLCGEDWLDNDETERVWQVVCFTEEDWTQLTKKFSKATSKVEKELYHSLSKNFLPEIPRLFQEKERLQRKRLLELAPRRTSNRVLEKIKQKEKTTESSQVTEVDEKIKVESNIARKCRANRRNDLRSQSVPSDTSESTTNVKEDMSQILLKRSESQDKLSKVEMQTEHPQLKTGRKTNNSLASVTGQIVIPDSEPVNSNRKRLKTSQIFSQTEEDIQTDMYKVLDQLTIHEDAWPFMDPVEEEYAPNYYAVIRRPMDLRKMEERLDSGYYTDFAMFEADFKLIVNNCRLYNGQDNEYTVMVDNLQGAFDRLTEKYIRGLTSSDDEIAVEYQLPSPSKKHKLKCSESVNRHKRMKRKSRSHTDGRNYTSSEKISHKSKNNQTSDAETKKNKESHKIKDKKKRKGHHRRRHSKSYKNSYALSFERHESFKAKYNKKQIRTKNKSDKKSKQKQKKIKSHVPEPDIIKRSLSPQSLESSNGSRSASPLPSILTPTPSPTELDQTDQTDQHTDLDNIKYKFGKVKEKTNVPKKIWESLLVYKEKNIDKQKQNLRIPETNKNQKLRETIEKLRTKNEKYKDSPLFDSLFSSSRTSSDINMDTKNTEEPLNYVSLDNDDEFKQKEKPGKMFLKKNTTKNESASEALKQAVKDISKWLDDAPNSSAESSSCDSLAQTIPTEENSNSRIADVFAYGEKSFYGKKELSRKQTSSRDPKFVKRREIQRTIDRLQPGKSKGNLLTNMTNKNAEKEEDTPVKSLVKASDSSKGNGLSPKLSLGSVLPTVEFTLGNDHSFNNTEDTCEDQKEASKGVVDSKVVAQEQTTVDENIEELYVQSDKKDAEIETQPQTTNKPSQEKATPNLSAWFKAFGAPKSTNLTPAVKKKDNEIDEKLTDNDKSTSPINTPKFDSLLNTDNANPDSLESPLLNASATPRQRRTSTGSSVSEKSSYSQDLDSPRHQLSHTSPLLRSPASPKVDDFQKITYPIINGTIRAGFYQDTTSIKSSPDKSYSPREGIQSPYSPYSQHVYASNNAMGSSSNTYFNNQNNSPRPTYVQHMPPYYESSKVPTSNKQERVNEDYATFGLGSYEQDEYCNPISPAQPSYLHLKSANYPETKTLQIASDSTPALQSVSNPKDTFFPVKKRTYNEHGLSSVATRKSSGTKDIEEPQDITDCPNFSQSLQAMSLSNPSVDNIARTLSAKSERDKVMSLREKSDSIDHRHELENRAAFENNTPVHESKKDFLSIDFNAQQKDNVDMVNMGYMNPDNERKNSNETNSSDMIFARDMKKQNNTRPKCYEVEAINLDLSNQQFQKPIDKSNINLSNISPAQVHEKSLSKCINQNIANANHMQSNDQSISRFSLNDIELANKKLFACNATPTATALNYDNWKMTNENRKQALVCNVSNAYDSNDAEKLKAAVHSANIAAANYNKNIQHEYNNYAVNKIQRAQELHQNISSELRIPNPRGLFKNDHANIATSTSDTNFIARSIDTVAKPRKTEKLPHNHPHVNPIQHKTSYSAHSLLPLERLRNLPNIPEMLQRYTNDERYISNVAGSTSTLYNDKTFDITQILSNGMPSDINHTNTSVIYSQPSMSKDNKTAETRTKASKRKKAETKQTQMPGTQGYHTSSCGSDVLSCVKSNMVPGTTFNFNTSTSMGLGGALFGDNGGFSVEDFRHSNQIMAAKYMAATVAHQQRSNVDIKTEKVAKPAHQNSSYTSGSFPFLGQSQVRSGYPFADPASPIYQQYFQRQELLRQTGAQIMGFYQPSYPPSLGVRQPYDSINRPSWL